MNIGANEELAGGIEIPVAPPPVAPPARPEERVHRDMMFLAGELLHRGAQTQFERRAAEHIRDRFKESSGDVELDDFHAIENPAYLFGSYFGEFFFVGLLVFLVGPLFSLFYGVGVLVSFLAEYHGIRLFGRLLPEFETQNVVARFLSARPRKLIIVTAHYDSGAASPLSAPGVVKAIRPALRILMGCMVAVIATCGAEAWADFKGLEAPYLVYVRWLAIAVLSSAAAFMFYASRQVEDIRGANGNASGVAALLHLAERLKGHGVDGADVWLAATGSHEAWMSGAQRILKHAKSDKRHAYILNIESVGAGRLHFTTREGLLGSAACSKEMLAAARANGGAFSARPAALHTVPTGAHLPLAWGYDAMSIIGLDEEGIPANWNQIDDRVTNIDEAQILKSAEFAEAIIREIARG